MAPGVATEADVQSTAQLGITSANYTFQALSKFPSMPVAKCQEKFRASSEALFWRPSICTRSNQIRSKRRWNTYIEQSTKGWPQMAALDV
jgi:hypothetical protein